MDKNTQNNFLILTSVLSLAILVEVLLLAGGLEDFVMTKRNLTLVVGTALVQFCTLMYVLVKSRDE